MAEVKVVAKAIRGSEHVHSESEGAFVLFVPQLLVNNVVIRTQHPDTIAWEQAGFPDKTRPDDPWPQPEVSFGEGFVVLTIRHADDKTWEFLQTLDEEDYAYESNREKFGVFVTKFEYEVEEPALVLA